MDKILPMKTLVILSLFLLLSRTSSAQKEVDLRIAYFSLPPHTVGKAGEKPPLVQYFESIFSQMKPIPSFKIEELPLPRLIEDLKRDSIDMVIFLAKNEERQKIMVYSDEDLFKTHASFISSTKKAFHKEILDNDLFNTRVCVWQDGYHHPILKHKNINLIALSGERIIDRCIKMIRSNRADFFFSPEKNSLVHYLKTKDPKKELSLHLLKGGELSLYPVFSKKAAPLWKEKFEIALRKQKKIKTYP